VAQALEFHQLDRRLEHLRVRHPARFRHLLASLAESGQQTPIIVIPYEQRYLVIDGHQRIAALKQLRRDTVNALVWEMSEAEALLLVRSLRMNSEPETAIEQGWLLQEMESRLNCSIEELARRFDRSATWVARRLALVETLPEAVQQQVREGRIAAQIAMRYLAPVARIDREQCERMAQVFAQQHWTTREAALLYNAWREARTKQTRERILAEPELFLKTQQQQRQPAKATLESDLDQIVAIARRALHRAEEPAQNSEAIGSKIQHATRLLTQLAERIGKEPEQHHAESIATRDDSGATRQGNEQAPDREAAEPLAPERAQGAAGELHRGAEDRARRESGAIPSTDPRAIAHVQRQSRASP
jgi:ParB family transcriptional regulator, chromosome partitioning protein